MRKFIFVSVMALAGCTAVDTDLAKRTGIGAGVGAAGGAIVGAVTWSAWHWRRCWRGLGRRSRCRLRPGD